MNLAKKLVNGRLDYLPVTLSCFFSRFSVIKKPPTTSSQGFKIGVDLLSHPQKDSTISASRLNFSVRDGKRWTLLL